MQFHYCLFFSTIKQIILYFFFCKNVTQKNLTYLLLMPGTFSMAENKRYFFFSSSRQR